MHLSDISLLAPQVLVRPASCYCLQQTKGQIIGTALSDIR